MLLYMQTLAYAFQPFTGAMVGRFFLALGHASALLTLSKTPKTYIQPQALDVCTDFFYFIIIFFFSFSPVL